MAATAEVDQDNPFADPPPAATIYSLSEMCKKLMALRKVIDKRKAELSNLDEEAEQIESAIIAQMQAAQLSTLRLSKLGAFTVSVQKWFRLPNLTDPENRRAALRWLKLIGAKELVREDINPQTLSGLMRDREKDKKPINPLIQCSEKRYLSVRAS